MEKNKISGWMVVFIATYSIMLVFDTIGFIYLAFSYFSRGELFFLPFEAYIRIASIILRVSFSIFLIIKIFRIIWLRLSNGQLEIVRLLKLIFITECTYQAVLFLASQILGNRDLGLIHILPKIFGYWLRYFAWKLYFEKSIKVDKYFNALTKRNCIETNEGNAERGYERL